MSEQAMIRQTSAFDWRSMNATLVQRLALIGLICVGLAYLTEGFASQDNLLNVLRQASLLFIIAAGLTLVTIGGGLDLSVGANMALSACLAAAVMKSTGSTALAVLVALGVGLGIGLVNGLVVTVLRIPSFLATYGMLWITQGIAYSFMRGRVLAGFPPELRWLGTGHFLAIPLPVWIMALIALAGTLLLRLTRFGRQTYLLGANPEMARYSGIATARLRVLLYLASGGCAGFAALVYLGRVNAADAGIGAPLLLPAYAAVLIGGTSLFGGAGGLGLTAIGAVILTLIINGLNLLNVDAVWHPLVTGLVILAAISADGVINRESRH